MNAKQMIQRAVNKAIADGSPIVTEIRDGRHPSDAYDEETIRDAARAMLAALKQVPRPGSRLSSAIKHQRFERVAAAIAQAEAAGITEGTTS